MKRLFLASLSIVAISLAVSASAQARGHGSPAYMVISVAYLNNWSETEII